MIEPEPIDNAITRMQIEPWFRETGQYVLSNDGWVPRLMAVPVPISRLADTWRSHVLAHWRGYIEFQVSVAFGQGVRCDGCGQPATVRAWPFPGTTMLRDDFRRGYYVNVPDLLTCQDCPERTASVECFLMDETVYEDDFLAEGLGMTLRNCKPATACRFLLWDLSVWRHDRETGRSYRAWATWQRTDRKSGNRRDSIGTPPTEA